MFRASWAPLSTGTRYLSLAVPPQLFSRLGLKLLVLALALGSISLLWLSSLYSDPSQPVWNPYGRLSDIYANPRLALAGRLSREKLKHRRFLVRDWTPWLGWNNVRYTIETGLVLAELLDRELVLPAFTYATACELDDQVCAKVTPMFTHGVPVDLQNVANRSQYPDPDEGTTVLKPPVPSQQWKGWVLPLGSLLDTEHVVASSNHSIRFDDFLHLTRPPHYHSLGMSSGKWSTRYSPGLSYRKVSNAPFTNFSQTMVDKMPQPVKPLFDPANGSPATDVPPAVLARCKQTLQKLDSTIPKRRLKRAEGSALPDWDDGLINGEHITGELGLHDHLLLERCIASHGMRTAYGYTFAGWWMKAPYGPTKYIRRLAKMVGFWDSLHAYDEQVLHIEGELHNGFPPGSMIWTSLEGREKFQKLVRTAIRPPAVYDRVAARLELRMRARCGGRSWRASHMRRGDFLAYEWAAKDMANQWKWIETNVMHGANMLQSQPALLEASHKAFNTSLEPPKTEDPIYLATNTRLPEELKFIRSKNVVLLKDLLNEEDLMELGFNGKFMDTLAVLEQCIMMRAGFFYGDGHSSVEGLILNRRTFFGIDERLTKIEYLKNPGDGQ